jgi:cell division protein DivIC
MSTVTRKKVIHKKKSKKLTPFLKLICLLIIGASLYLLYSVAQEVYTTITLKQQLAQVQAKLTEVTDENTYLNSEKDKLTDPDYVQSYARGNYMLSKDGEQIFYLPEDTSK